MMHWRVMQGTSKHIHPYLIQHMHSVTQDDAMRRVVFVLFIFIMLNAKKKYECGSLSSFLVVRFLFHSTALSTNHARDSRDGK